MLPIPIGAYNYLYALSSVRLRDFVAGMALGSIKPYALDCYLGSLISSALLSTNKDSTSTTDLSAISSMESSNEVLGGVVLISILVIGTLATQLFTDTYQEINAELQLLDKENSQDDEKNGSGIWRLLRSVGIEQKSLPTNLQSFIKELDEAWVRVDDVLTDEVRIDSLHLFCSLK